MTEVQIRPELSADERIAEAFVVAARAKGLRVEYFGMEDGGKITYSACIVPQKEYDELLAAANRAREEEWLAGGHLYYERPSDLDVLPWEVLLRQPTYCDQKETRQQALLSSLDALMARPRQSEP